MKGLSIAGFMLAATVLAVTPALTTIYREAYPAEAARRAALAGCGQLDPGFNRLIASERAQCYAHFLQAAPDKPPMVPRHRQIVAAGPAPEL